MIDLLIVEDKPERAGRILAAIRARDAAHDLRHWVLAPTATAALAQLEGDSQLPRVILLDHDLCRDGELSRDVVGDGTQIATWLASRRAEQRAACAVIVISKNTTVIATLAFLLLGASYPMAWAPELPERPAQADLIARLVVGAWRP